MRSRTEGESNAHLKAADGVAGSPNIIAQEGGEILGFGTCMDKWGKSQHFIFASFRLMPDTELKF